eukprot:2940221-Rhodomonas_salina.2
MVLPGNLAVGHRARDRVPSERVHWVRAYTISYALATRCPVLRAIVLRACYAMSSADLVYDVAYGATQVLRYVRC